MSQIGFGKKSSGFTNQHESRFVKVPRFISWAMGAVLAVHLGGWFVPTLVHAKGPVQSERIGQISQSELPPQGRDTYGKILQGGPFPYEKDGVVFGNRERILPNEKRGYYREYTVKTPASRDRGAKRIVCGGKQATEPDACFYSDDHYSSFKRIAP